MNLAKTLVAIGLMVSCPLAAWSAEAEDGQWITLFGGEDLSGWQSSGGGDPAPGWVIEDDGLVRDAPAGYLWTRDRFGDFVLSLEFKTQGNSGIFIRTGDPKNCVQTGIEVAINRPAERPGTHSTGALYDLVAPTEVADKPAGEWNDIVIAAKGSNISVELNGSKVVEADLDRWTEPNKNPDGSRNKFNTALKDFPREGHIGFQDHGAEVAFRNVRIKPLDK